MVAGLPDIIGCYRGLFIAFEVKRDGTLKPTRLQLYYLERIRRAGGIALLTHSVEAAEAELDRIDGVQEAQPHQS
jgi:penicillin-binding protein-related factor A (putative recombinase)